MCEMLQECRKRMPGQAGLEEVWERGLSEGSDA